MDKLKILVVDDSEMIQELFSRAWASEQIDKASDGKQALEMVQSQKYDIILCDYNMPVMNGLEFLEKAGSLDSIVVAHSSDMECNKKMSVYSDIIWQKGKKSLQENLELLAILRNMIKTPRSNA